MCSYHHCCQWLFSRNVTKVHRISTDCSSLSWNELCLWYHNTRYCTVCAHKESRLLNSFRCLACDFFLPAQCVQQSPRSSAFYRRRTCVDGSRRISVTHARALSFCMLIVTFFRRAPQNHEQYGLNAKVEPPNYTLKGWTGVSWTIGAAYTTRKLRSQVYRVIRLIFTQNPWKILQLLLAYQNKLLPEVQNHVFFLRSYVHAPIPFVNSCGVV